MVSLRREATQLLVDWSKGDGNAAERLMPLVYDELRRLARQYLRSERADHTLQATSLVHEAYLRLVDQTSASWQDRAHFLGVAAHAMRRILIDHARSHNAAKRGGGSQERVALDEAFDAPDDRQVDLLALDDALRDLGALDERQSRIVELRFFGGLTTEEIAELLEISPRTIKREWRLAKAWLRRQIAAGECDGATA